MFDQFIAHVKHRIQEPLPGAEAQYKMAPIGRKTAQEYLAKQNIKPKIGCVMILLYPSDDKIMIPLTLRSTYDGTHSGQVSFPGGKHDEADTDLSHTALRETEEELGIQKSSIVLIGKLTDLYIPPSNFLVHPFLGYCNTKPSFKKNEREVAEILEVETNRLADKSIIKQKKIYNKTFGWTVNTPYYEIANQTVWGATAMIISELNELILNEPSGF
jgi:8-oxo-dGTP pyrophosphatase MutT (NUDIX family)